MLPYVGRVARRWEELSAGRNVASEEALVGLITALASNDEPEFLRQLAAEARRLADAGASLSEVLQEGDLLAESVLDVVSTQQLDHPWMRLVMASLAHLGQRRALITTCVWMGTGPDSDDSARPATLGRDHLCGLVGGSDRMQRLYDAIERAARGRQNVLVVGESGTGKELIARAIHALSGDPVERFVAVNCAALPRELVESELFGFRRGAFSGAHAGSPGLVGAAEGGTLFLDEVTELPAEAQAKLLRLLQEHAVRGVGELRERDVRVRIVASTNQDLGQLLRSGKLRRDLFYRLQRVVVNAPPLREHLEDLPPLVAYLAAQWAESFGERPCTFSTAALEQLAMRSWLGNVRELENVVHAACAAAPGPIVRVVDLPEPEHGVHPLPGLRVVVTLEEVERAAILHAMDQAHGNKSLASRALGISRKQLYVKLRQYGAP